MKQYINIPIAAILAGLTFFLLRQDSGPFFLWWLMVLILGWSFMPVTSLLFSGFSDKGWMRICHLAACHVKNPEIHLRSLPLGQPSMYCRKLRVRSPAEAQNRSHFGRRKKTDFYGGADSVSGIFAVDLYRRLPASGIRRRKIHGFRIYGCYDAQSLLTGC